MDNQLPNQRLNRIRPYRDAEGQLCVSTNYYARLIGALGPLRIAMAGYSGTPLVKKLGIKAGSKLFISGAPDNYSSLLEPMPPDVEFVHSITPATDIVHLFTTSKSELASALRRSLVKVKADGAIWVS